MTSGANGAAGRAPASVPSGEIWHFRGLPCVELALPRGDRAIVTLHGAQLLSWTTADGQERLYLSPKAVFDGRGAIRGGVPLCFPQFNQRSLGPTPLPKHGFARTHAWSLASIEQTPDQCVAELHLTSDSQTLALWPHHFAASCAIALGPDSLSVAFSVKNTGEVTWPFAMALHTYLHTDDISQTELLGLDGLSYWDALQHQGQPEMRSRQTTESLRFASETDRVYSRVRTPVVMRHPRGAVRIEQSASLPEVVVWNPGAVVCAALGDMPADGFKSMLCVEAARIHTPQTLMAGESWRGWQSLRAMPDVSRAAGFQAD
jgi:glucose-6-phosphate 1-epimerase